MAIWIWAPSCTVSDGNVKVRARHTVYNGKRDGIIIFQFKQNVGDDLHRSSRQLYSIGRIAHNILNGKASVQQRRQHIAVNVDTQILDQNIRQFLVSMVRYGPTCKYS